MRTMKITPAFLPNFRATLPSFAVASKENFNRLREAGFARSIPTDDKRQTGTRGDAERLGGTDSAEPFDLQRRQVCASMSHRFGGGRLLLSGCGIAKISLESVACVACGKDSARPFSLPKAVRLQTILNERAKFS